MITVEDIFAGNKLALSRALSAVENQTEEGSHLLSELYPRGGKGYLIGVTGSPGTGKSTLVNQLALQIRAKEPEAKIAILAIDPTSPFTGGAVLGDRVRMRDLSGDENIFIRSMASRGALGGLAQQTAGLAQVFDGAGYRLSSSLKLSGQVRTRWISSAWHTPPWLWKRPGWVMTSRPSRPVFWRLQIFWW